MEVKFNYIMASSNDIKLLGKLTEKNHLSALMFANPVDFDKVIYTLYKNLGIYEDQLISKFFDGDVIDKKPDNPAIGYEYQVSSWTTEKSPKDFEFKPLDIAIYVSGESLDNPLYWEPILEQQKRIYFLNLASSEINKRTGKINLPFSIIRHKSKYTSNYRYGYIDGRRHHIGAYMSKSGLQACSKFPGYEVWQEFIPEFTIAIKEENGSTEGN